MTAPCDPEATPEPTDEEQEIVLRLGDILPRVPVHLLKAGPHDTMSQVRFSVDELAEKISRGRVSVPLERLASACPEVFRGGDGYADEQEIQLPLQKLLEQVGLVAPKPPAPNGMPEEQFAQARAEASRIIEAATAAAAAAEPEPPAAVPSDTVQNPSAETPPAPPPKVSKAVSTVRQIFSLFGRSRNAAPQGATETKPSTADKPSGPPATPSAEGAPETAKQPVPAGYISLRVLPIFRLLPSDILRSGAPPSPEARLVLPLSAVDSQIAGGHVEIPLADLIKALPESLRPSINSLPEKHAWIPLDEIFQNLPPDHLFYMPPLDALAKPAEASVQESPAAEVTPENKEAAPEVAEAKEPAEPAPKVAGEPAAEAAPPETAPPAQETTPVAETTPEAAGPAAAEVQDPTPEAATSPAPAEDAPAETAAKAVPPAEDAKPDSPSPPQPAEVPIVPTPAAAESQPATTESQPATASPPTPEAHPTAEAAPTSAEPPPSPPEPAPAPPPSRAPWMRGFQVPPPRLIPGGIAPKEAPSEPSPAEPIPPAAPTPEAKRTVDFLASQAGIFAAAAFVQGAVFASADFPRKPDLDALRDFMGAFVDHAQEAGKRLGWNRVLTIACEQFHITAVVRDVHFIAALHHDRVLPSLSHDALITAADELSNAAAGGNAG